MVVGFDDAEHFLFVARTMRQGYVTVHVTVGRSEERDSRKFEGFWLLGLDSNQQPSG
jgi:hypothetical protein